ncbi:MAG TPA: glycosyltransferase family A protein, partial [Acidimicrobiales bacterium]|nr:glycosyltransferase family A protein [Acidimicrobiales bacterium]
MPEAGQAVITVVVPTYKRPHLLEQCLRSLAAQDLSADRFEIVVIDDASGDDTREVLEQASRQMPNLAWRSVPENRGPAHARNLGVRVATADLILFIDDDIAAAPKLLRSHVDAHSSGDPLLGVVGLVEWYPGLRVSRFMRFLDRGELQFAYRSWMREGPIDPPWKAFYTCNL